MLLENLNIDTADLPRLEDRDFKPVQKDYFYFRISSWSLFFFMLCVLGAMISLFGQLYFGYWLFPILGLWLWALIVERIAFKFRGYSVRDLDVSFRRGWLFKRMTTVPLNRVQHCEFSQGPISRLFDLATVKIFTAGGTSSDLDIRGLHKEEAIKLRDHIMELSSRHV